LANFKRGKPKDHAKEYRNGDIYGCGYCGANWLFKQYAKKHLIEWEIKDDDLF